MSICRLCAASDSELISIFTQKQMRTIADMVQEVTSVEVPIDDPHSVLVCSDCIETTLVAFNFIKRVQEVDRQFEDKLHRVDNEGAALVDVKQDDEMLESSIFDADGVELIDHSASTMPTQNLLTLGDGSVEIVDGEPDETAKELLQLFVESIQHSNSDKWYKLKCDRDFAELLTGSVRFNEEDDHLSDVEEGSNLVKNEASIARCCDRKCKTTFQSHAELFEHGSKVHGGDRHKARTSNPFKCLICLQRFKTRRSLVGHMRNLIVDYRCRTCDVYFNTQRERDGHVKNSHEFKTSQRYKIEEQPIKICCGCEAKFESMEELYQHGTDVHKTTAASAIINRLDYDQECNICYKLFKNKSSVRYHQISVYRLKRFICGICNNRFETSSKLINHKRVHITERKFVCDTCGGKFKSNSELRLHNKSHEEPQLMCSSCGARFRKRSHLQVHLKVHDANAYEFTCHVCQKQFKHKYTLKEHLTIHTGERVLKYACPHCSKKFPRNRDLQTHLRRVCEKGQ
uniref:Uncharacterized zinc finger protein 814 n=1 Tax=Culex pipiens TaxID=7175 RepID=A0A8D8IQE1_CULPI